jgi:predicted phage baseplate assembly protein
MEFDFLPKLPKSNLDDRTFQDLVDECLLRIPRYCPEWTNYNPSDPGITLVELFAWLTDQMLLRFNQVPRRNYVTFLELLGIRLQAATPAQTDVTFYLTTNLGEPYTIPAGAEVATLRTETEEAIVFSTDRPVTIGCPTIQHFLTAETTDPTPQVLRDRFTDTWNLRSDGLWEGRELNLFNEQPQPGNCFYLVFAAGQAIEGNVIALNFKGEAATPTGINPDVPPRRWEAWNGETWEPVLLQEFDDATRGFSFHELAQQGLNPLQGADVLLHLPQRFPVTQFTTYQGHWLRCTYAPPELHLPGYSSSPRIVGLAVRAIGGTAPVSQSTIIENELLGESDGTPGQAFKLQSDSILPRRQGEHLLVTSPGGLPQIWTEVSDFSDSSPTDLHYTIDSLTGIVQFGPLIREPAQLKRQVQVRARTQVGQGIGSALEDAAIQVMERQYGAIPPRGSVLRMASYRTGGGQKGNVQRGALQVLKSAIPYVTRVINHASARNGADAESLDEAVIRVPRLLRTRDRAVTREDFEALALQAGAGAVSRALCPAAESDQSRGTVRLLIVPEADREAILRGEGMNPNSFDLNLQLKEQVLAYLNDRKLLGVKVQLEKPEYVGVAVQTEVALEPEYNNSRAQREILAHLRIALYRFLNPLTGGPDGKGWAFGRPVYPSDIVTLFQQTPYVRYLGVVQLFELRQRGNSWVRTLPSDPVINPGPLGLICSWADPRLRSGHVINLIQTD